MSNTNTIELEIRNNYWHAKVFNAGKSAFGFIMTPYSITVSRASVKASLKALNPQHTIVFN